MDTKRNGQKDITTASQDTQSLQVFGTFVSKKSDRLATALYLVTSFLSDNEPLKNRLRTLSLDLVKGAFNVRYGSTTPERTVLETLIANIGETLALLEVAFMAGNISEMNFIILKREYGSLRDKLEVKKLTRESRTDTILGDDFFGERFSDFFKGHSKEQQTVLVSDTKIVPSQKVRSDVQKSEIKKETEVLVKDISRTEKVAPSKKEIIKTPSVNIPREDSLDRQIRRTRILKLIKDKREVTIKDISNDFPDVSEKTIQRELVALTFEGVLLKSGDRRWSRYSIKK